MNEGIDITNEVMCCVFLLWSFVIFLIGYTIGNHAAREEEKERTAELENKNKAIQDAIELMDEEPAKEILKQALKGSE